MLRRGTDKLSKAAVKPEQGGAEKTISLAILFRLGVNALNSLEPCVRDPDPIELVRREIREIRDALEAFGVAVEAGQMTGFKDGGIRSQETRRRTPALPLLASQ